MKKLLFMSCMIWSVSSWAQSLSVIVSLPPGSGVDIQARTFVKRYDELYGTQSAVANRPGAEGALGVKALLESSTTAVLFPSVGHISNLKEEDFKRLVPLVEISKQPLVLIARKNLPVSNWSEFVEYSKNRKLTMGVGARAGSLAFTVAVNNKNSIDQTFVYYSTGQARGELDVASGVLDLYWVTPPVALTVIDRVKILATSGLPDPNYGLPLDIANGQDPRIGVHYLHYGIFVSAEMNATTRMTIADRMAAIAQSDWAKETFKSKGITPTGTGQVEFGAYVNKEWQQWNKIAPFYKDK